MNALPKFCVFCGAKPENKTKEHVIPKWLIELTGYPERKINVGVGITKQKEVKLREFSFSSFHFPACAKCNEEFSVLENATKPVIEKILIKDFISNYEINILLNWFDKVRIGVWLAALLLDREAAPVDPHFYIKKRMAEKDRCLFVYELNDHLRGIQFIGFDTPAFLFTPSCFALCVNNFYFFNMSIDFLFAKNIGFPFPSKKTFIPNDNRVKMIFHEGSEKIKMPLIRKSFVSSSIEIYQPIIPKEIIQLKGDLENFYRCDYVKGNCLDFKQGLGDIFYNNCGSIVKLDNETELCLSDASITYQREKFFKIFLRQVLETQLYLTMQMPSDENLTIEGQKRINKTQKSILKFQKEYIKLI
jgi:hypothetical protein